MILLTQPFSTIYNLYHINGVKEKFKQESNTFSLLASLYPSLPTEVESKIRTFVSDELQFDVTRLDFREVSDLPGPVMAKGSIHHGKGIICFTPEVIDELKIAFKAKHKFMIAHEFGHLINDDNVEGEFAKEKTSQWIKLGAYCGISFLSYFFVSSLFKVHLLGCVFAKCAELYARQKVQMHHELRADLYAATKSSDIAKGGVPTIHQLQQHNLKVKEKWLSDSSWPFTFLKKIGLDLLVSKEGDIRFISPHPSGQTRLDQITPYLKA